MAELTAWLDAGAGVSGDMLLGACVDAGAPLDRIQEALHGLGLDPPITVTSDVVRRGGQRATKVTVDYAPGGPARSLADIRILLAGAALPAGVAERASATFDRLAAAESRVHGVGVEDVHFHEVGALDSIADIVGTLTALATLGVTRVVCSPIALGAGTVETEHGPLSVPGPAVTELLRGSPATGFGGPEDRELATPTGVALALTVATEFGPMPALNVTGIGVGAGTADPPGRANVCRLVLGTTPGAGVLPGAEPMSVIETNVDDLDPRLWEPTLAALLGAGAADAWLSPIQMKKGRPAHTLHVLAPSSAIGRLAEAVFTQTSSIGLRISTTERVALTRDASTVEIAGFEISVKRAYLGGRLINAEPEFADVLSCATALGLAPRDVLRRAQLLATIAPERSD